MYEIFEKLLEKYGVTPYKVSKATGIATATLSDWKNGKSTPKLDKMQKIADYFGVSLDYLLGNEEKENPPAQDEQEEMYELLEEMRRNPDIRTMFSLTKNATPEQVRQFIAVIKALRGSNDE